MEVEMSEGLTPGQSEVEKEAIRLRQRHDAYSKDLMASKAVFDRAQALRDKIKVSNNPEEEFSYQERTFANGESTQDSMLKSAQRDYSANMWDAQEHSRDNRTEYIEMAKRDAEAAGIKIDTAIPEDEDSEATTS